MVIICYIKFKFVKGIFMGKIDRKSQFKLGKLEIVGKRIKGEYIYRIVDCDKSFCDICEAHSCNFDFFLSNNPLKAKIFINEVYKYMIEKNPQYKGKEKTAVVRYALEMCSGYDDQYDFLFRGDKLISIKFDKNKGV